MNKLSTDIIYQSLLDADRITNSDHAKIWLDHLISEMRKWRGICDIRVPDSTGELVKVQQRALWTFLQKQGQVMGALDALYLVGIIDLVCYEAYKEKAIKALNPVVTGDV